jgi:hypothetical protein
MVGCGIDSSGSGQGPVVDSCEHSNKSSCSIKYCEFFEWLSNYWLFKLKLHGLSTVSGQHKIVHQGTKDL